MSNSNKMKGLLKGLRYISQIFDNEKEPEMQIGYPTDVKHVAHIGWDGPSVNSPSWMNEFNSPAAYASAPLNLNGDARDGPNSAKWVSGDSDRRIGRMPNSTTRDLPELPKASRRQHSSSKGSDDGNNVTESPTRGKSEKTRHRRSSKNASNRDTTDSPRQSRRSMDNSSLGIESPARNLPDIPKKSRRRKSKESNTTGGSSRSRSKAPASPADQFASPFSDPGPGPEMGNKVNYPKSPIYDDPDEIKESIT